MSSSPYLSYYVRSDAFRHSCSTESTTPEGVTANVIFIKSIFTVDHFRLILLESQARNLTVIPSLMGEENCHPAVWDLFYIQHRACNKKCFQHDITVVHWITDPLHLTTERTCSFGIFLLYFFQPIHEGTKMPVAIAIKPALRKVLGDEAEAAFVDVLNQIQADQRNGFERSIEMHLQAFREYLDRHLIEADAKTEKRFAEADAKTEKRFAEADLKNEKRFAEADAKTEKRFAEADAKTEKRFAEADLKNEKRFAEADAKNEKRFAEADAKNEKRFNEIMQAMEKRFAEADVKSERRYAALEIKIAQSHASLIRWMFAFFIGMIFSLASLLFVYFQLLVKVKP
ncbi:MAG: hypothetical protein ONB46_05645 [candidate division KSB1 bacterium]|nr:hypothetical protein [candidate division KSB1 bacterium]MDZ7365411.1 hypothetical protein [candidate division KSB1 bacterium]MDZ7403542.1 hypothetical protein [candidate division KSB1 bacterium]